MNILWVVILILLVLAVFGAPGLVWQHSYGYGPSGAVTIIVIILVVLLLTGRL